MTKQEEIGQISEENYRLRVLLWSNHPCEGKYGDDGELQCNRLPFLIDFKRDSINELERKCAIHNLQRQNIAIPDFLLKVNNGN